MRAALKSPLFIALAVVLTFWLVGAMQPPEFVYWNSRFKLLSRPDPTGSVIVSLDGEDGRAEKPVDSLAEQARLLKAIRRQHPRHIYFDYPGGEGATSAAEGAFVRAVAAATKDITLVLRGRNDPGLRLGTIPAPGIALPAGTSVAASVWYVNFYGYAGGTPPAVAFRGKTYPTVAAHQRGLDLDDPTIIPDFAVDPRSVARLDAGEVLAGRIGADALTGKTVYVTTTNPMLGTSVGYFGHGRVPSVMADIAGVAGIAKGHATQLGKLPLLLLFVVTVLVGRRLRSTRVKLALYGALAASLLVLPAFLLDLRISAGGDWALVAMVAYFPARLWQRWRRRVQLTNTSSGLPNIAALEQRDGIPEGSDVIAASIGNYEKMLASLPRDLHGECARQIARRLSLASGESKVHVTDNGHFVWLEQPRPIEAQISHFEGLKSLFSAPLVIGGHMLDTNIHFGLDRIVENSPASRIQSALASAAEAQRKGGLYSEFERQRLAQAPWELSLHARIDEGLRNGDIWLALQAQYDLRSGRISGAEALIRWSDPERGAIPPDAFILQAERAGRIEAITYWVLEKAIIASQALNQRWHPFHMSVNLSARLLDQPGFLEKVAEIVAEYKFDCTWLTFEVTETFSMANREEAKRKLDGLRKMGFRLSIDDFGTGQASLSYLAEIPSDEIKLDRSFVKAITTDEREWQIVSSMIDLAHKLGQEVVAEGVEDGATLEALRSMNCDFVQGYFIGRPVAFADLVASLSEQSVA